MAPPTDTKLLAIYLNDHLAGSTAAVELVRRAAREHEGTELGAFLARIGAEIVADRQALRRIMAAAGARIQVTKVAAAWAGERAGRLKLNGRVVRSSPLSPLIELEALSTGIHGKLELWRALREQRPAGTQGVDLDDLIARAERQLDEVETHRLAASAALRAG